ncbi:MAG: glycosyltransferase family 2 protein [Gaiellaceae bacterium]
MSGSPEVSVVIPTRNRWQLLSRHGLPSALGQRGVELEVIVVDDGSTDETPVRLAALDDARVRVIRIDPANRPARSRNTAQARNRGIEAARGEWIAFLDDDDLWSPAKLRAQIDVGKRESASFVYSGAIAIDEKMNVLEAQSLPDPGRLASLLLHGNFVPGGGSNAIAKAELIERAGHFDETLVFVEDWDLWIRLTRLGHVAACQELHVARFEHGQGALFRERPDVVEDVARLLRKYVQVGDERKLATSEWLASEHYKAGKRRSAAALYFRAAVRFRSPGNLPPAVGALLGDRGMRVARRLLLTLRGTAHFGEPRPPAPPAPAWLDLYRSSESRRSSSGPTTPPSSSASQRER